MYGRQERMAINVECHWKTTVFNRLFLVSKQNIILNILNNLMVQTIKQMNILHILYVQNTHSILSMYKIHTKEHINNMIIDAKR